MKKVIIIGAGLAGLSCGITLQRKGIETEIFEMAPWAGGVCTSWVRKGYTFDGCVHWMVGTKPGNRLYEMYVDVGALDATTRIYHPKEIIKEYNGKTITIPLEYEPFKTLLLETSPLDRKKILVLCKAIHKMMTIRMPSKAPEGGKELWMFLTESGGFLPLMMRWLNVTVGEYLKGIQSEDVKRLITTLMPPSFSMIALIMMLGTRMSKNGGYPEEGAKGMIRRMQGLYQTLGGKIHFQSPVDEIIVEDGVARGVKSLGEIVQADHIVAACDMKSVLDRMLMGKHPHPVLQGMFENSNLFSPLILVSFGLKKQFGLEDAKILELSPSFEFTEGVPTNAIHVRSFEFDPTSAPDGKSSVMVMIDAPYAYWSALRKRDLSEYRTQKNKVAAVVAEILDSRIPGFRGAIEVTDVATPATYERLNGLYKASYEGFLPLPKLMKMKIPRSIATVKNLSLCGQWLHPGGGIPVAIQSGLDTASAITKKR